MKTEGVRRRGYTEIYHVFEPGVDFEPSDDLHLVKCLARYNLHDGFLVWQVEATYARNMKPAFYYVVSYSRAAAMSKFLNIAPWLGIIKSVVPLNEADAEVVLSNPAKFILW